jgi:hypothetical protein
VRRVLLRQRKELPRDVVGVVRMQVPKCVGRQPPCTLQGELNQLLRLDPEHSRAHYVAYLNQLEHGDYPAAVDSLHRYFDFSAAQLAAADANIRGGIMGAALGATSWQVRVTVALG